jgi:hypothetical protein
MLVEVPVLMRTLIPALLALLILGCGRGAEQTKAIEVANPPDNAPAIATVPGPPPTTPPSPVKSVSKDGWVTLQSGLRYKDKKVGEGPEVTTNTRVTVQYKGWLDNGKVFDSSRRPGREPYQFTVDNNEVIKGWDEGLKGMRPGGVRELTIPPALAYGDEGHGGVIPPKATLHFEIELLNAAK